MAELISSLRKSTTEEDFTKSVMEAAQQLMQLSGSDNNNNDRDEESSNTTTTTTNNNNNNNNSRINKNISDERVRAQSPSEITSMKMKTIAASSMVDEEAWRPKKQRYRSLVDIYMATKPLHGKKRKY